MAALTARAAAALSAPPALPPPPPPPPNGGNDPNRRPKQRVTPDVADDDDSSSSSSSDDEDRSEAIQRFLEQPSIQPLPEDDVFDPKNRSSKPTRRPGAGPGGYRGRRRADPASKETGAQISTRYTEGIREVTEPEPAPATPVSSSIERPRRNRNTARYDEAIKLLTGRRKRSASPGSSQSPRPRKQRPGPNLTTARRRVPAPPTPTPLPRARRNSPPTQPARHARAGRRLYPRRNPEPTDTTQSTRETSSTTQPNRDTSGTAPAIEEARAPRVASPTQNTPPSEALTIGASPALQAAAAQNIPQSEALMIEVSVSPQAAAAHDIPQSEALTIEASAAPQAAAAQNILQSEGLTIEASAAPQAAAAQNIPQSEVLATGASAAPQAATAPATSQSEEEEYCSTTDYISSTSSSGDELHPASEMQSLTPAVWQRRPTPTVNPSELSLIPESSILLESTTSSAMSVSSGSSPVAEPTDLSPAASEAKSARSSQSKVSKSSTSDASSRFSLGDFVTAPSPLGLVPDNTAISRSTSSRDTASNGIVPPSVSPESIPLFPELPLMQAPSVLPALQLPHSSPDPASQSPSPINIDEYVFEQPVIVANGNGRIVVDNIVPLAMRLGISYGAAEELARSYFEIRYRLAPTARYGTVYNARLLQEAFVFVRYNPDWHRVEWMDRAGSLFWDPVATDNQRHIALFEEALNRGPLDFA